MECKECKGKLQVKEAYYTTVNDTTPDLPTEVYHNADIACLNNKCTEYGKVTETIKTKMETR